MDLRTAVSVSMLPANKARVAAMFKALRERSGAPSLEALVDALGLAPADDFVSRAREAADQALAAAPAAGLEALGWFDERYPPLLACTPDPPPVLWVRGDPAVLGKPVVAIVGSRAATPYALQVATRLAAELAGRQVIVVSGLARGVDSAAHVGCLEAGGRTAAVLGSGLDRVYPPEHDELALRIAARGGAVLSELGPGAPPLAEHFPLRNRIISGLSLGVVVVEASEKSGSLITARCALEQGRDVLAVPGSVLTGRNRGSHALLKDGAKIVETADDILEELGWPSAAAGHEKNCKSLITEPLLAQMQPGEVYSLEELVETTGMRPSRLLTRLTELELLGHVSPAGGGRYSRHG
jgi:DNA processing protein